MQRLSEDALVARAVELPPAVDRRLGLIARRARVSRSEAARQILEAHFQTPEARQKIYKKLGIK